MLNYFSHDYHARHDPKIQKLFRYLGLEGIGLYWCLLEYLYEQNGEIKKDHIDDIAFDMRTQCERITNVLNTYDLFYETETSFRCLRADEHLKFRFEKSEKASKSAEKRWFNANAMRTQCDGNAIKEKESKVKEIKEKNIIPPSVDLISEYCKQRKNGISAQSFFDYYETRGWQFKTGQKMKDWQAAIRTWEKNKADRTDIKPQKTRESVLGGVSREY